MATWFSTRTVTPHVVQITEPYGRLYPEWRVSEVHSYLLIGEEGAVLVDTGMGGACPSVTMERADRESYRARAPGPTPASETIVDIVRRHTHLPLSYVNTHAHDDHIGGNVALERSGVKGIEPRIADDDPRAVNDGSRVSDSREVGKPTAAPEGPFVDLGGFSLHALPSPGHSPDHRAFYSPELHLICCGDLLYRGNINVALPESDWNDYAASVQYVYNVARTIGAELFCPGHGAVFTGLSFIEEVLALITAVERGTVTPGVYDETFHGIPYSLSDFSVWRRFWPAP